MFIIYGLKTFKKLLWDTEARTCSACGAVVPFRLVKESNWIAFFYIPMIPAGSRHQLYCSSCGHVEKLNKAQVEAEKQKQAETTARETE